MTPVLGMDIDISMWKYRPLWGLIVLFCLWAPDDASAEEATVAVASNFLETATKIAALFGETTDHDVRLTAGSTGQLYAKILHGAPFDVFLAADAERPHLLVEQGLADQDTRFTYAIGVLALYSSGTSNALGPDVLRTPFRTLSIANPKTAPYGAAALQVLEHLNLTDSLPGRIAQAQNVTGAFAAVGAGAADLGFVALSSVISDRNGEAGSYWLPPQSWYQPLRQDAVQLQRATGNPAAGAFLAFLKSPDVTHLIDEAGYELDGR